MKVGGTTKPRSSTILPRTFRKIQHFVAFLLTICIIKLCTTDISYAKTKSTDDGGLSSPTAQQQLLLPPRHPILGDSASTMPKFNSTVKFVFFVGIEGTGHHTLAPLIRHSPSSKYLEDIGIIPDKAIQLARSLWDAKTNQGFLNAHCDKSSSATAGNAGLQSFPTLALRKKNSGAFQKKGTNRMMVIENKTIQRGQQQRQRRLTLEEKQEVIIDTPTGPDTQKLLDDVVVRLEGINSIVSASNKRQKNTDTSQKGQPIHMAINTWKDIANLGELSFPNGKTKCRILSYPNLDLLYQACRRAQVDCGHVYIYRDPYNVIRSTARRNLHSTILEAIHLYTSYLYMIYGLLATNYSERTLGCWGVLAEKSNSYSNQDIAVSSSKHHGGGGGGEEEKEVSWKEEFKVMFRWNNLDDEFQKSFQANYKAPIPMTEQQKQDMVPPSLRPYIQSMYKAHQNVVDLCREQVSRQSV